MNSYFFMLHLTRANQVVGSGKDINDIMDEISDCCYLIVVPQKHDYSQSKDYKICKTYK